MAPVSSSPRPKRWLKGLGIGVVVLVLLAVFAPRFIPMDTYRALIETKASAALGGELRIKGPLSLRLLPAVAVQVTDVTLSQTGAAPFATIPSLDVAVEVLPLLHKEIRLKSLVFQDPRIDLRRNAQGKENWITPPAKKTATAPAPQQVPQSSPQQAPAAAPLKDIALGTVGIRNGNFSYHDEKTGKKFAIRNFDLTLTMPSLDAPATLALVMTVDDQRFRSTLTLDRPRALMTMETTALSVAVDVAGLDVDFKGRASLLGPHLQGDLTTETKDLSAFVTAVTGAPATLPIKAFSIRTPFEATPARVILSNMAVRLDDVTVAGKIDTALGGKRPKITGALDISPVDLDRLMPPAPKAVPQKGTPAAAKATQDAQDAPLDLSALSIVDADVQLKLAGVRVRQLDVGATTLGVTLSDGQLRAMLSTATLLEGTVAGDISLSQAQGKITLDARTLQIGPALAALADFHRLEGRASVKTALYFTPRSIGTIQKTLSGNGEMRVTNGAIKGINIAAMMRNVTTAFTADASTAETDFAELSGTFTANQGVIRNDDLVMLAPLFRLNGAGSVTLPTQTVDYRLTPKLAGTLEGQGGASDVGGLSVPVMITGTFDNLSYRPDLTAAAKNILNDPKAALKDAKEQAKALKDAVKNKENTDAVKGALKGLFGK